MAKWKRDAEREAFWRGALARQRKSGLTVRAFCGREGVSEPSFYAWRRVVRERDQERREASVRRRPTAKRPRFVPVVLREAPKRDGGGIVIDLQGGRRMHVAAEIAPERLAAFIHALEASPTPEARP